MELLNEYFGFFQEILSLQQGIPLIGLIGLGLLIPSGQSGSKIAQAISRGTILGALMFFLVLAVLIGILSLSKSDSVVVMAILSLPSISTLIFYTILFICLWANLIRCRRITSKSSGR